MTPFDLLLDRLNAVSERRLESRVRYDDAGRRFDLLQHEVGLAKTRAEWEPSVQEVLEALQRCEHERAVGAYEQLLSLLLRDVLPGERDVVLDLYTERGLPALDVFLRKGEGQPLEDALHGSGGSVANVLSAGLRFISLVRSGKRPLLVLDEPDCWIAPTLAPRLAAVIQQMSQDLGVQVVLISHHADTMFDRIVPHRVLLERGSQGLTAQWAPTSEVPTWAPEQKGLRSLEMINCQSHAHTFLPLSPGLTLLQGANDLGKSVAGRMLRAVFYDAGNDKLIRHHAKSAKVVLDFGPEHVLTWERWLKGNPKAVYTLTDPTLGAGAEPLHRSEGAREVPDWVASFGISLIDGLDVQLSSQLDPVFLLNKPARERARALAIGGESGHVQRMLALAKQELQQARQEIKQGEKALEALHRVRQALAPSQARSEGFERLVQTAKGLTQRFRERSQQQALLQRGRDAADRCARLAPAVGQSLPSPPTVRDPRNAQRTANRWKIAARLVHTLSPIGDRAAPSAGTAPRPNHRALNARWAQAQRRTAALMGLGHDRLVVAVPLPRSTSASALSARWRPARVRLNVLEQAHRVALPALISVVARPAPALSDRWQKAQHREREHEASLQIERGQERDLERQWAEAFPRCPLCEHAFDPSQAHGQVLCGA